MSLFLFFQNGKNRAENSRNRVWANWVMGYCHELGHEFVGLLNWLLLTAPGIHLNLDPGHARVDSDRPKLTWYSMLGLTQFWYSLDYA